MLLQKLQRGIVWYTVVTKKFRKYITTTMDQKIAKKVTKAIVEFDHPLLDFRSKEAKNNTNWVYDFLKPHISDNCKLIDIGCGTGKQSFPAEELGAKVTGIDCSREAIKYANRIKNKINSNCQFIEGDYTDLPFIKNTFNVAIFPKNIIECSYSEIDKLCSEVKRILKKNGKFIVSMEDGLNKVMQNKEGDYLENYELETGKFNNQIVLPNKKKYYYPIYLWTIAFAKQTFSRNFQLEKETAIDKSTHMLVFRMK